MFANLFIFPGATRITVNIFTTERETFERKIPGFFSLLRRRLGVLMPKYRPLVARKRKVEGLNKTSSFCLFFNENKRKNMYTFPK